MKRLAAILFCATLSSFALGRAGGPDEPPPPPAADNNGQMSIQGIIVSFNYNNRGLPESLILRAQGQIGQVNFEEALADAFSKVLTIGQLVEVTLEADAGPPAPPAPPAPPPPADDGRGPAGEKPPQPQQPDHAVYRLVSLRDATGHEYRNPIPPRPSPRQTVQVQGTVAGFNYDRRGLANGLQLDTGDVIRIGPREAEQILVNIGDKVTVAGPAVRMANGHWAMQAQQLNGATLAPAPGGPGGPEGRGRGAP